MGYWHDIEESTGGSTKKPFMQVKPSTEIQKSVDDAFSKTEKENEEVVARATEEAQALNKIQQRLIKANYYRAILDQCLFEGDVTREAAEVESEMREFALKRLGILMGLEVEEAPHQNIFTDEEILALKTWAAKILNKPAILDLKTTPAAKPVSSKPEVVEPKLKPVQASNVKKPGPKPKRESVEQEPQPAEQPKPVNSIEKEITFVDKDGVEKTKTITLNLGNKNVGGQVASQHDKPVPMPPAEAVLASEAARAEANASRSTVLQQFLTLTNRNNGE